MQLAKAGFWRNKFIANSFVKYHDSASNNNKKELCFISFVKITGRREWSLPKIVNCFYFEPPPPFLRGEGDGAAVHSLNFNELGETK